MTICYYDDKEQYHREDGPAVIWSDSEEMWCLHGKIHRTNGPAFIEPGCIEYWINDCQIFNSDDISLIDGNPENILYLKLKYGC